MGQHTDNALAESPHRVVKASAHKVKCANQVILASGIYVRTQDLVVIPGSAPSPDTPGYDSQYGYAQWFWEDYMSATDGGSPLGAQGCIDFYSGYKTSFDEVLKPTIGTDWSRKFLCRAVRIPATAYDRLTWIGGVISVSDVQRADDPGYWYRLGNMAVGGGGTGYQKIAASGSSIDYGTLRFTRGQVLYRGTKSSISYWVGRVRSCFNNAAESTFFRLDLVEEGTLPVFFWPDSSIGEAKMEAPFTASQPFPLESLSCAALERAWAKTQAVTNDFNLVVLEQTSSATATALGTGFEWNTWLRPVAGGWTPI